MGVKRGLHVVTFADAIEAELVPSQDGLVDADVVRLHDERIAARPAARDEARLCCRFAEVIKARLNRLEAKEQRKHREDDHEEPRAAVIAIEEGAVERPEEEAGEAGEEQRPPDDDGTQQATADRALLAFAASCGSSFQFMGSDLRADTDASG